MSLVLRNREDSQGYHLMEKGVKRKREDRNAGDTPSQSVEGAATAEAAAAWEAKSLYVFVFNSSGPMVHTLYAIDIPNPLPDPPPPSSEPKLQPLSPILEFPRRQYPCDMCCVALDSKLYFFGGGHITDEREAFFPCDVHILDISSAASEKTRCPTLTQGPKMNTGKVKPIAFVHDGEIYVLSGFAGAPRGLIQTQFEVLVGINNGGGGAWTELQGPPFKGELIYGHAVVNRKVFVLARESGLWCLLLDSMEWRKISGYLSDDIPSGYLRDEIPLNRRAEFFEDTLYSCSTRARLVSYRPLRTSSTSKEEDDEELALLNEGNRASSDMEPRLPNGMHPSHSINSPHPSHSIRHIGKRRLCHVLHCAPLDHVNSLLPGREHPEIRYLTLTIFEDLKDTYTVEGKTFFKAKVLHSARFIIKTSDTFRSYIYECIAL